jgi:hypothetical protein
MTRRFGILPAIWLLAVLLLPMVAWLLGARQPLLENRPKTPRPALTRSTLAQKSTFKRLDTYFLDRLPLRKTALGVHAHVLWDVFDTSPSTVVAIGHNGWLYYKPELGNCLPAGTPVADPADAVDVLARTLVASGRRTTVAVTPSKFLVHKADLPSLNNQLVRCESAMERRVEARLARTPGGVDLLPPLLKMEAAGESSFLRSDTHWNWRGRALWTKILLNGVRPGLADEAGITTRPIAHRPGDLGRMIGLGRTDPDRIVDARRVPKRPPDAADYLIVGDSQTGTALLDPSGARRPTAEAVLPGVGICTWKVLGNGPCDEALVRAKSAVFEIVARDFALLTRTCWRPVTVAAAELHGRPGQWVAVGAPGRGSDSITVPAKGSITVSVRPPGGDRSAVPRLLRLPLTHLATSGDGAASVIMVQKPRIGPPAPCATLIQTIENNALFLPVPAGRRDSDLKVELSAPPGTRLGRPEEIVLDGKKH